MKYLSIFLVMLLIGMAGAQSTWYPRSADYNTTGDVNAANGAFTGNMSVSGILTAGSTVNNGVIDGDVRLAANHSFYSTIGSGGIDWSNGTGAWKMPTGTGTIGSAITDFNGAITCRNITLDNNYHIVQGGTGTFTSGTGAFDVNGAMTTKGITQDSGSSLAQSGASGITVGTAGITASASPLKLLENVTVSANKSVVLSGTGTISGAATISGTALTASGTVQGEQVTSTDDAFVTDDLTVDGGARIDETATVNALVSNTTATITSADGLTVGGVIVPQEMVLTIPIGASEVDRTAFVADDAWQITKIEEVHSVAQNTAYPNTGNLSINKCTGTQAPNAGAHLHNTTMWLNSTINAVATPTLNAATGALNLADGNRICLDFNGTMTTFAGGCVTVHMKRI